jgi:hypothetical protein
MTGRGFETELDIEPCSRAVYGIQLYDVKMSFGERKTPGEDTWGFWRVRRLKGFSLLRGGSRVSDHDLPLLELRVDKGFELLG